ncbi:uncharacterized protein C5orf47 homolog isoform X2 [Pipra filicauda]|uniref:Uncharacterized protein C5orf47 homolog isoform X2 n=1 Tax=Pipra filicauda TaxID=649802 RepID=A0A6J2GGR1_9PASS|nr:uncharacterized protein C5orf47 homolog isoform X2 [Pipra filicauda]
MTCALKWFQKSSCHCPYPAKPHCCSGTRLCRAPALAGLTTPGVLSVSRSCCCLKDNTTTGDKEAKAKAHTFDFPIPSKHVDKVIKRKKKKSKVWHKVWKVISKMLEENERFRSRLLACSQLDGEGSGVNQTSQNGAYLDREESIFGWV